jgi:hypothetical protein
MAAHGTDEVHRLRTDRVTWREVDGEIIVLDRPSASYFAINDSAARLWRMLVDGATTRRLVSELVDSYGIEEAQASSDADAFLTMCRESDLLEP